MEFWSELNPWIRRSIVIAVVLVGAMLVMRQVASTPMADVSSQRGVGAPP